MITYAIAFVLAITFVVALLYAGWKAGRTSQQAETQQDVLTTVEAHHDAEAEAALGDTAAQLDWLLRNRNK